MWSTFILVQFQWNLNFLDWFSKNTQISTFMTIRLVGAKLFHADRRTDEDRYYEADGHFSQLCKRA